MIDLRYPNITGRNEKEQIAQIRSYLIQLVDQLNYVFPQLGNGSVSSTDTAQSESQALYEMRTMLVNELDNIAKKHDTDLTKLEEELYNYLNNIMTQAISTLEDGEDGLPGADGHDGADGKTPVKGVDYFTEAEIASVSTQAAQMISFTLDADGNLYYEVEE